MLNANRKCELTLLGTLIALIVGSGLAIVPVAAANDCSPWDAAIGQSGMDGPVYSLAALPDGDIVAGGAFTTAGGVQANRVARWDGSDWHPLGDGVNGLALSLAVLPDGDVIAGGSFTTAGGAAADRLARWDGSSWHALGSGVNGHVWDMVVLPDGDLVVAGAFTTAGGIQANRIARWDGNAWHALGGGFNDVVRTLAVHDSGSGPMLYAAGSFTVAGGNDANRIAKWDGDSWSALGVGVDGTVRAMQVFDDGDGARLYVAGDISNAGPLPLVGSAATWDGSQWLAFGGGIYGHVSAMAVLERDGEQSLYVMAHQAIDGSPGEAVMKWDAPWWRRVSPLLSGGGAQALVAVGVGEDASLYIGGGFDGDGETQFNGIVKWQACPTPEPQTHHVPAQYATIQAAIDAAADGDIVLVSPGTYHEAIDYLGKTIIVESEQGAEATIIDASGLDTSVVTVNGEPGVGTVLRGFTITGGIGTQGSQGPTGGGVRVYNASFTIDSCIVTGNGAEATWAGGGLDAGTDSDVLVINTTFSSNAAALGGGAIVFGNRQARFIDCAIRNNTSANGGGININNSGNAMLLHCTIEANAAAPWPGVSQGTGGGVLALITSVQVILDQCDILANTSTHEAGGVYVSNYIAMRNCRIQDNHAGGMAGGGARIQEGWIEGCTFEDNTAGYSGGGLMMKDGFLLDCTFDGNRAWSGQGGGALIHGATTVSNCTFARNVAGLNFSGGGIESVSESLIEDSHFCENTPFDIGGPYQDGGGNNFAQVCEVLGDLNGDGMVDVSDLLILLAAWGTCPRSSDCPADLNGDGVVDISDLLILLSNWG